VANVPAFPQTSVYIDRDLVTVGNSLYFPARNLETGFQQLWKSNGTAAGTQVVADIWPYPSEFVSGSLYLTGLIDVGGTLFFAADDGIHGRELYALLPDPMSQPPAALGDFNGDSQVDAADYCVWRDTLGQSVSLFTGADANGDGTVTIADYDIWKSHFGQTLSPPATGGGAGALALSSPVLEISEAVAPLVAETAAEPRGLNAFAARAGSFASLEIVTQRSELARPRGRLNPSTVTKSTDTDLLLLASDHARCFSLHNSSGVDDRGFDDDHADDPESQDIDCESLDLALAEWQ
jgi:ELWxxDGT repeat protein